MKGIEFHRAERNVYESPSVGVVELDAEGVLCLSGANEEWNEGTLPE